MLPDPI